MKQRWLSVNQIREGQRMRRETMLAAMMSGECCSRGGDSFATFVRASVEGE